MTSITSTLVSCGISRSITVQRLLAGRTQSPALSTSTSDEPSQSTDTHTVFGLGHNSVHQVVATVLAIITASPGLGMVFNSTYPLAQLIINRFTVCLFAVANVNL